MLSPALVEMTQRFLFSSDTEMSEGGLSLPQIERVHRLRDLYLYWVQHPTYRDKVIVGELMSRYGIGMTQAYDDVRILKHCLGNINQHTKEYHRYLFVEHCLEAIELAREKEDANAYAKVMAAFLKGTQLDKDDTLRPDYSQIVPERIEITTDPTVVGGRRIPNLDKRVAALMKQYAIEVSPVEEVAPLKNSKSCISQK